MICFYKFFFFLRTYTYICWESFWVGKKLKNIFFVSIGEVRWKSLESWFSAISHPAPFAPSVDNLAKVTNVPIKIEAIIVFMLKISLCHHHHHHRRINHRKNAIFKWYYFSYGFYVCFIIYYCVSAFLFIDFCVGGSFF